MTTTSTLGASGLDSSLLDQLNAGFKAKTDKTANDEMDQTDFLRLMTTQLKNQDPTKPLDGQQFMAQLAQFSTLNGIIEMKASLDTLSQSLQSMNTLQATSLVGHSVLIETDQGYLRQGQSLRGNATVTESVNNLTVTITDAGGRVIRRLDLGAQAPGTVDFVWDGLDDHGVQAAAGPYTFRAEGTTAAGKSISGQTELWTTVSSVSLGQKGQDATLNLESGISSGLGQVKGIQ